MSESSLRVIVLPSLVYPYFEHDIEQDEIMQSLVKQARSWMNWMILFLFANS